jgi:hypothetical protein
MQTNKQKAEYMKIWRRKNLDRAREIDRNSQQKNRLTKMKYAKNYFQKNKARFRKYRMNYFARLINKVDCSTNYHFKLEPNCGICKTNKNLQFHHWIYKLPVERKHFSTLCKECHNIQHRGGGLK